MSLFIFPSESPVREPPPCSLTGSPWTLSPEPLVHSFMYVWQSPQKGALLYMGKNLRSPSMEPHADGRPTYSTTGCSLVPQGECSEVTICIICYSKTKFYILSYDVFYVLRTILRIRGDYFLNPISILVFETAPHCYLHVWRNCFKCNLYQSKSSKGKNKNIDCSKKYL
jgi:hypothetical protein